MARMNFQPVLTFIMIVVAVIVLAYALKNPNFKNMLTGLFNKLKGVGGGTGGITPAPQQQQQVVAPQQPAPTPTSTTSGPNPFTGRSTGPGTRSQDSCTQAINRCVGVGVNPPDPQAYNDCVNAACPKANRARIGIA